MFVNQLKHKETLLLEKANKLEELNRSSHINS